MAPAPGAFAVRTELMNRMWIWNIGTLAAAALVLERGGRAAAREPSRGPADRRTGSPADRHRDRAAAREPARSPVGAADHLGQPDRHQRLEGGHAVLAFLSPEVLSGKRAELGLPFLIEI